MSTKTPESMLVGPKLKQERKPKPAEEAMKCPRCHSTNTKFCYYNNYSLSQPRYFCKSCRKYWTKEGTLKNISVGGGSRKNKRSSSSSSKKTQENLTLATTDSNQENPFVSSLTKTSPYDYSCDPSLDFARINLDQEEHNEKMGFDAPEFSMIGFNNNSNPRVNSSPLSGGSGLFDDLRRGFQINIYRGSMVEINGHKAHMENEVIGIHDIGEDFEETRGLDYEDAKNASSINQEGDQSNNKAS